MFAIINWAFFQVKAGQKYACSLLRLRLSARQKSRKIDIPHRETKKTAAVTTIKNGYDPKPGGWRGLLLHFKKTNVSYAKLN